MVRSLFEVVGLGDIPFNVGANALRGVGAARRAGPVRLTALR